VCVWTVCVCVWTVCVWTVCVRVCGLCVCVCVDCAGNGCVLLHRPSLPITGVFTSPVRHQETEYGEHFGCQRFASLLTGAASWLMGGGLMTALKSNGARRR
jgi:hypothetical protein